MSERSIVLVSVDSLRADHCSHWGYDRETTPALDAMAAEGVVFENAVAPGPSTPESMPATFTGQYPVERRAEAGLDSELRRRRTRIRAHMTARETLAERLSRRGYATAAFTPNPFTSRHFGFDQGFDHFQDFMTDSEQAGLYQRIFESFLGGSTVSSVARMVRNFWRREEVFKPWETYYDEVVEWARSADGPYFLWVFLMDAHNPYMADADSRTQSRWKTFHANYRFWRESHETPFSPTVHDRLVRAYDDSLHYADRFLARLREDLGEDPVVVVHGDHGEAFGEHGAYGHGPHLESENLHVPLVVAGGGQGDASVADPVSLRQLPALLDSIATSGTLPSDPASTYAVARTMDGEKRAVRGRDWHFVDEGDSVLRSLGGDPLDRPDLTAYCRQILEGTAEVEREHRRIVEGVIDAGLSVERP